MEVGLTRCDEPERTGAVRTMREMAAHCTNAGAPQTRQRFEQNSSRHGADTVQQPALTLKHVNHWSAVLLLSAYRERSL